VRDFSLLGVSRLLPTVPRPLVLGAARGRRPPADVRRVMVLPVFLLLLIRSPVRPAGSVLRVSSLSVPQMARLVPPFIGSGRRRMDGDRALVIRNLFRAEMLILSPGR
jgi:hypothetical protein